MDGLITWLIVIGAVMSLISKSSNKKKPVGTVDINGKIQKILTERTTNPRRIESYVEPKYTAEKAKVLAVDTEGFSDEEGTSFGDGDRGTEGECDEGHESTLMVPVEKEIALEVDEKRFSLPENLKNAVIFAEVLGPPRSKRR